MAALFHPWSAGSCTAGAALQPGYRHTQTATLFPAAGHCIYNTVDRQPYDVATMAFYPAQHGGQPSERSVGVQHVMTVYNNAGAPVECGGGARCQRKTDRRYDFAVLTLEEDVGDEFGFLAVGYACDNATYAVQTAGYPGDLPGAPYTMYGALGTLQTFAGCDVSLSNNVITSDLDTGPGQSGSGIWDDEFVIRAVHVAGGGPLHRAISHWVYQQIKEEVEAHSL
jgi:V8-like Glu-specific endopeptidase